VYAQEVNTQQARMKSCNSEASTQKLKGDERKNFMRDCLSGKAMSTGNSQQERMKRCNIEASGKNLKGDARKDFLRQCLKG
jgi:hypothetical protein